MANKRDETIDICKGVGILLVVLGHLPIGWGRVIYHFHMALFFMLSGWCFKEKYLDDKILFIKKKAIDLLWPYLFIRGLQWFLIRYGPWNNFEHYLKDYHLFGTLWFLEFLFVASLMSLFLLYAFRCILKRSYYRINKYVLHLSAPSVMLVASFVLSALFPDTEISGYAYVTMFYLFGFAIKNLGAFPIKRSYGNSVIIDGMLILLLLVLSESVHVKTITTCDFVNIIPYMLSSMAGSFFIYRLSCVIGKRNIGKVSLIYLGQNTMPIVILQWIAIGFIDLLQYQEVTSFDSNLIIIAKFLSGVVVPLIVYQIYLKIPFLHITNYIQWIESKADYRRYKNERKESN